MKAKNRPSDDEVCSLNNTQHITFGNNNKDIPVLSILLIATLWAANKKEHCFRY